MIRATAPRLTATLSTGAVLDVKDAELALDEAVAPYVRAQLTLGAPSADLVAAMDPRRTTPVRATITVTDGADLFGLPATSRTLDVMLRTREYGDDADELRPTFYSDEQVLIDRVLLLANVRDWQQTTVRGLVGAVLAFLGYSLAPGTADMAIDPAAAVQSPGQSFWDFLDPTVQGANLRLWCDEARVWRLTDKGTIADGLTSLAYDETVTGLNDAIGLDENYYDSLVIRFSYLDRSGNAQTSYDYAAFTSAPRRGTRLDFSSAPLAPGTARRFLRRMRGRGRVLTVPAVNRFDVSPTQSFIVKPRVGPVQSGLVSAVTWRLPDDRMDVRTRELTDTIGTTWAAQGAGVSWASIPAGTSWTSYLAIPWTTPTAAVAWSYIPAGYRWDEFDRYLKENS